MDESRRLELGQIEVVFPKLPSDLIFEIFSRLPAESLMRCKCVCKSWSSLIRNPLFVTAHRKKRRSLNQNTTNLIFIKLEVTRNKTEGKYYRTYCYQLFSTHLTNDELGIITTTPPIHLPIPPLYKCRIYMTPFMYTPVVSAGIVCHHGDRFGDVRVVHILNPSTREVVSFPVWQHEYPDKTDVALGFNSLTNEYKLLHVHLIRSERIRSYSVSFKFKVFTLGGTSSTWKEVPEIDYADLGLVPEQLCFTKPYLCIHGAIHWVQSMNMKQRPLLLAFDVAEERFRVIPLPQDYNSKYNRGYRCRAIEVNGQLAVFDLNIQPTDTMMDFWILKDYQSKVWFKERIVFPNPWGMMGNPQPFCSIHTGELLLSCKSSEQRCFVHLYDMKLKTYKKTDIVFPERSQLYAGGYEETISPFGHMHHMEAIKQNSTQIAKLMEEANALHHYLLREKRVAPMSRSSK